MLSFAAKITGLLSLLNSYIISAEEAPECAYYLTQSKLEGAMRGIYAGKDFIVEEQIEEGPVVNVISAHIKYVSVSAHMDSMLLSCALFISVHS
jgi:hypothetical protein